MRFLLPVLGLAVLSGCGDDEPPQLISPEQARELALTFCRHVIQDETEAYLGLCRAPFTFRTRRWDDEAELRRNLPREAAALKAEIASGDAIEVYSHRDLMAGRWPRGETVAEDQREARARALGISAEGYLARVHPERGGGVLVVMNLDERSRFAIQGLH